MMKMVEVSFLFILFQLLSHNAGFNKGHNTVKWGNKQG